MNTISSLTTPDLTTAFAIETRAHAFPWSEKTFASNQGERYLNYRLDVDGTMAAFAITQVVLDEARDVFTLWLEVRASNVAAIALYESLGFNEATIRRNYYPTAEGREDAIIMALPIG